MIVWVLTGELIKIPEFLLIKMLLLSISTFFIERLYLEFQLQLELTTNQSQMHLLEPGNVFVKSFQQ